jgi:predicted Fe-S protein YdhL (DUF1289 family)
VTDPSSYPSSPCLNVCVLDERRCCRGCRRTLDEIVRWAGMSAAEQWAVIARLERLGAGEAHPVQAAKLAAR